MLYTFYEKRCMNRHATLSVIGQNVSINLTYTPNLNVGELITKPLYVGVCGTDLQIIRRQRPDPVTILGHEGIAYVLDGCNETKGIQAGDVVIFNPVNPSNQNEILGHNIPGLLQKRYVVSAYAVEYGLVVPFPKDTDPLFGPLVEPLGTVIYGHNLVSTVVRQSCIAIVGAGAIGGMHALYAQVQGYNRVLVINASPARLEWCVERGIVQKEYVFLDSDDLPKKILDATNGEGVDAVYMCTSRPSALHALGKALKYLKDGGCIDLVGGIQDGDRISSLSGVKNLNAIRRGNFCGIPNNGYVERCDSDGGKKMYLTGHRGTSLQHLKDAMEKLRQHGDIFSKIISHIVSFDAAVDLFKEISRGSLVEFNGFLYMKAIVDMRSAGYSIENYR